MNSSLEELQEESVESELNAEQESDLFDGPLLEIDRRSRFMG